MEARLQDYPTLRMPTAKLIDEYPQPKQAEKQAEKRAQAQTRQEQRRSDAAAETIARDTQEAQGQTKSGSDAEAAQQTTANLKPDMSDAPAPMKQEQPEGNPVTKGVGRRDVLGGGDPNNVPRAMLFYLDNFLSADPRAAQRQAAERAARQQWRRGRFGMPRPPANPQQAKKNERGLNENYGRELMELHTLGVDGGYTQKDVTEVARCFTGWTIDKPRQYADFKFDDRLHDPDPKIVLGKKIHAGGMKDGEQVIDLLVHHPSTTKFISTKLARRFVSDNPPPALVSRMAETFQSSDGDIKAVLHTMIWSPEFWSRESYRAKIKTPFELVVSAVRALGTDVDTPMPLVQWVGRIGEPLYQCQPPTGYSDKADAWVNTGALLNRLNYSLALAGNKMRGARTDVASLLGVEPSADPKAALDRAVQVFLGGQAGATTVETLKKQLDNPQVLQAKLDDPRKQVDLGVVAGLVLGAPEFQRR
jgi:hypothetical protein